MMIPCHIPSLGSVAEEDVTKGSSERRLKFEGLEAYASSGCQCASPRLDHLEDGGGGNVAGYRVAKEESGGGVTHKEREGFV